MMIIKKIIIILSSFCTLSLYGIRDPFAFGRGMSKRVNKEKKSDALQEVPPCPSPAPSEKKDPVGDDALRSCNVVRASDDEVLLKNDAGQFHKITKPH